jgi:hypothetical protein
MSLATLERILDALNFDAGDLAAEMGQLPNPCEMKKSVREIQTQMARLEAWYEKLDSAESAPPRPSR